MPDDLSSLSDSELISMYRQAKAAAGPPTRPGDAEARAAQLAAMSDRDLIAQYRNSQAAGEGTRQGQDVTTTNVLRAAVEGMPVIGGMAPNLAAAIQAATQPWLGRGSDAPTFQQRVSENLARGAARSGAFAEQHPWENLGAQVAGGTLAMAPLAWAAPAALGIAAPEALAGTAWALPARVGIGAASGGAMSAADAALRGAPVTPWGVGLGAATGAGIPGVSGALGAGARVLEQNPLLRKGIAAALPTVGGGLLGHAIGDPLAWLYGAGAGGGLAAGMRDYSEPFMEWLAQRFSARPPPLRVTSSVAPGITGPQQNQPPQTPYGVQ